MSSAPESSQGPLFPDISVSLIVVTNLGDYMNRDYELAGYETSFHAIKNMEINPNATACILVVQGYSDLCEFGSLGQWMAEDDQLRSIVNQYLAPAGQRYWLPRTPANCLNTVSAYWVRPVAQTQRKMDREKKMQDSHDRAFSPQVNAHSPPSSPLEPYQRMSTRWPPQRLQPFQILGRTEDENLMCIAAEERIFYYACEGTDCPSKPAMVNGKWNRARHGTSFHSWDECD